MFCPATLAERMNAFILHGLGGSSQENWFPWAKCELEERGHTVIVPDFPAAEHPTYAAWEKHLDRFAQHITGETTFIGHSLGCPFGLRYLGNKKKTLHHFILVAPPFENLGWKELRDMFQEFPPKDAAKTAKHFTIFASDNDPYIPLEHVRKYEELLGMKATILKNREHLWQETLPELVSAMSKKINNQ